MSVRTGVRVSRGIERRLPSLALASILMERSKPNKPRKSHPRNVQEGILSPRIPIPIGRTDGEEEEVEVCRCPTAVIPLLRGPVRAELHPDIVVTLIPGFK